MLLAWAATAPFAFLLSGRDGIAAAAVAVAVCFAATWFSIRAEQPSGGEDAVLRGLFLGMLYRMGLPIAAVLVIKWRSQTLWEAGAAIYLLEFFLVGLVARTMLTLPPTKQG